MKCLCNHCSTPLEFDAEHVGETIQCPDCKTDTILYSAGEKTKRKGPGFAFLFVLTLSIAVLAISIPWANPGSKSSPLLLHEKLNATRFHQLELSPLTRQALQVGALKDAGLLPGISRLSLGTIAKLDLTRLDEVRPDIGALKGLQHPLFEQGYEKEELEDLAMDAMSLELVSIDVGSLTLVEWESLANSGLLDPDAIKQAMKVDYRTLEELERCLGNSLPTDIISLKLIGESSQLSALRAKAYMADLITSGIARSSLSDLKLASEDGFRLTFLATADVIIDVESLDSTNTGQRAQYIKGAERRLQAARAKGTFPDKLAENCIRIHGVDRCETVMDPFVGIGNSAIGSLRCEVGNFIGIDIDGDYLSYAQERVDSERRAQAEFFTSEESLRGRPKG